MQKIVGVKRYKDRDIYYFLQNIDDINLKDKLVVNFEDFQTVVEVVKLGLDVEDEKAIDIPKILRKATKADIAKYESLIKKAEDYLPTIKKKSLELGLAMKFVSAEYSLDNSKIIIVFSSEDRVDFRQFLKELALILKIRIELKQIGQRDEVKIIGGVGICGQQCCCARFLKEFEHVTVKMAKTQGLSLSPTKINGICGRLMCCLGYEASMYEKLLEKMPKVGSRIKTPNGEAVVVYNDILRERVSVKRQTESDSFIVEEFTLEEIQTGKKAELKNNENKESNSKLDEFLKRNAENPTEEKNAQKINVNVNKHSENKSNNEDKNKVVENKKVQDKVQKSQNTANIDKNTPDYSNSPDNSTNKNNTKDKQFNKKHQNKDNANEQQNGSGEHHNHHNKNNHHHHNRNGYKQRHKHHQSSQNNNSNNEDSTN